MSVAFVIFENEIVSTTDDVLTVLGLQDRQIVDKEMCLKIISINAHNFLAELENLREVTE